MTSKFDINTVTLEEQEHLIKSTSRELNKRFCADRKLSLKIHDGEIFIDRLKLFGEYDNYILYCKEISERFANTQDYFAEYNAVKDRAIDYIKNSETFQTLNSDDMNKYACHHNFPQADVYKANSIGKSFISIDMIKANFSSLVSYGRIIGTEFYKDFNYTEFMRQFTDIEHIIDSKYIRQVIFGNCNPKRQVTYEKYLMGLLVDRLLNDGVITPNIVKCLCSDEIILQADDMSATTIDKVAAIVKEVSETIPLKLEHFTVGRIDGSEAYIKKIYDGLHDYENYTYKLKCVNPEEAPFVYRLINRQEFKEDDSIFTYNGKLAKLLEQPVLKINFTGEYN